LTKKYDVIFVNMTS